MWDDYQPDFPDDWSEDIPPEFDEPPDPFFLGRADLLPSGELWADIYADTPTGDYNLSAISFDEINSVLGLDEDTTWADFAKDMPFTFDADDPNIRGPFFDEEAVNNFITETGMYWAEIYYDPERDEYFINVTS